MSARPAVETDLGLRHQLRIQAAEAKHEFLKVWRQPAYVIPTLGFPLVFDVMFGIVLNGKQHIGGVGLSTYMLATYGTFGVMAAAVFGFAVGVATERGLGWLQVKRASPMPALWLPLPMLPDAFQHAARLLPAYHLGQRALWVTGAPAAGRPAVHATALAGFTLLFASVALRRFDAEDLGAGK
jgi:hypothetical protein